MSGGEHTQGRLVVKGARLYEEDAVIDCVATMQVSNQPFWYQDARRLAACWNAFQNIPTEHLESAIGAASVASGFIGLWSNYCDKKTEAADLRAERDTLLQHLQACVTGWQKGDDVVGPMHAAMALLAQHQPG